MRKRTTYWCRLPTKRLVRWVEGATTSDTYPTPFGFLSLASKNQLEFACPVECGLGERGETVKTFSAVFILIVGAVATAALAAGGYHLLQEVSVPGDEGWDHPTVYTAARRLYVA